MDVSGKMKIFEMNRVELVVLFYLILSAVISFPQAGLSAEKTSDQAELAKKSLNPIAAMISLPVQLNYDSDIGPSDDGEKIVINIQPVIPISLSPDWNLISRTILPIIDQEDILPDGAADESGIGDIVQSLFFSPKSPTSKGWIWGVGPVSNGKRRSAGWGKMGDRSHGGSPEAGAWIHIRCIGQSYLVDCG